MTYSKVGATIHLHVKFSLLLSTQHWCNTHTIINKKKKKRTAGMGNAKWLLKINILCRKEVCETGTEIATHACASVLMAVENHNS